MAVENAKPCHAQMCRGFSETMTMRPRRAADEAEWLGAFLPHPRRQAGSLFFVSARSEAYGETFTQTCSKRSLSMFASLNMAW